MQHTVQWNSVCARLLIYYDLNIGIFTPSSNFGLSVWYNHLLLCSTFEHLHWRNVKTVFLRIRLHWWLPSRECWHCICGPIDREAGTTEQQSVVLDFHSFTPWQLSSLMWKRDGEKECAVFDNFLSQNKGDIHLDKVRGGEKKHSDGQWQCLSNRRVCHCGHVFDMCLTCDT